MYAWMDRWMDGWMNDDGWHSLNPNQNNVLDGLKPGNFILKLLPKLKFINETPKHIIEHAPYHDRINVTTTMFGLGINFIFHIAIKFAFHRF